MNSIIITKNTPFHLTFEKVDKTEPWFDHNCSNENLLKQCNREGETIKRVQWDDGKYIGSLLHVYFENQIPIIHETDDTVYIDATELYDPSPDDI